MDKNKHAEHLIELAEAERHILEGAQHIPIKRKSSLNFGAAAMISPPCDLSRNAVAAFGTS